MASVDSIRVEAWRKRHPDRAVYMARMNAIRGMAARHIAARHQGEYEREIRRLCVLADIPRYLPPLPDDLDLRKNRGRT